MASSWENLTVQLRLLSFAASKSIENFNDNVPVIFQIHFPLRSFMIEVVAWLAHLVRSLLSSHKVPDSIPDSAEICFSGDLFCQS